MLVVVDETVPQGSVQLADDILFRPVRGDELVARSAFGQADALRQLLGQHQVQHDRQQGRRAGHAPLPNETRTGSLSPGFSTISRSRVSPVGLSFTRTS